MHPSDFKLRSNYGADWPLTYEDLEPYYCDAEEIIGVAGDSENVGPYWRSRPYPMPAFMPSDADHAMRKASAYQLALPCARTSVSTGPRALCCARGNCRLCPNDAKFTALNGMDRVFSDPRVTIATGADAKALETQGGMVRSVVFSHAGALHKVDGDFVVLGANAIFNAAILHRSGLRHRELGVGINEQIGYHVEAKLTSLAGVNGGTAATGMYCGLIDGDHRKDVASAIFFDNRWNFYGLRREPGKFLNKILLILNSEDMRQPENYIETPDDRNALPVIHHANHSSYGEAGINHLLECLPKILEPLEVEEFSKPRPRATESHLQGTTLMGGDAQTGIVDADLVHHQFRNLCVVGTSVFPTCPVANPSLTAAALSLRAADRLLS